MTLASKRRIFYVDHNEDARLMMTTLFTQQGYEVITANSSLEALAIARQSPSDIYILDLRMPEMDGAALAQKIREFDSRTPIIIYSGAARESDKQMGLRAGANLFIAKPYIGELIDAVTRLLG